MSVNAIACAPRKIVLPDRDPGGWREPLGTSTRAPSAAERVPANLTEWWRANLGRAASGPPSFGSAVIAALALDRYLTVFDPATGDRLWRRRLSAPGVGGPLVATDRIYAATGGPQGRLYGFSLTGRKLWDHRLEQITGPIALVGTRVFAATETGLVTACDAATGAVRWRHRLRHPARAGVVAVDDGLLVATDDSLRRLRLTDGSVVAAAGLPGTVVSPAAAQGDTVIVATADGQVVALRLTTLEILWSLDLSAPILGGPAIARDTVFAVSIRGDLWSIPLGRPGDARARPIGAAVRAPPAPVQDGVLIGTLGGEIVLVREDSVMGRGRVEGPIEQPVIVRNGVVYVLDGRGRLFAWH